jgi:hypothetical protein
MAIVAEGWRRLRGPHPEVSDRSVRFQAVLWSAIAVVWLVVLVLALTLAAPTSPLMVAVYVLALLAAAVNGAVWIRVDLLRRADATPSAHDAAVHR